MLRMTILKTRARTLAAVVAVVAVASPAEAASHKPKLGDGTTFMRNKPILVGTE